MQSCPAFITESKTSFIIPSLFISGRARQGLNLHVSVELQPSAPQHTHHVGLPQRLAHAVHLLGAGAAHDEVLGDHGAADEVQRADEGFERLGVEASDHGLDVVRPEPNERNTQVFC